MKTFPMFLQMAGRHVVIVGGGEQAAQKARQIKSKMETLLEPALGELAALAGRLRPEVNHRIPHRERRIFWDWVFNGLPRQTMARGAARDAAKFAIDMGVRQARLIVDRYYNLISMPQIHDSKHSSACLCALRGARRSQILQSGLFVRVRIVIRGGGGHHLSGHPGCHPPQPQGDG